MFIKAAFIDSKKVKRISNYISVFLDITKVADFWSKNIDVSET